MKTSSIQLLAILATVLTASAKESRPPKGHRPPPPPSALFEAIDTDHDGTLSAEEIKNAAESIAKLDTNGDGEITRDELQVPPPPKDAEGGQEPSDGKPPGPPPEEGEAPQ